MYWLVASLFTAFGLIALFSIGLPFSSLGVAMLVLRPLRSRPRTFWPWFAGVAAGAVASGVAYKLTRGSSPRTSRRPG